jgi:protein SCO1/2
MALPKVALRPGEQFSVLSISFDETETPVMARGSEKTYMTAMRGEFPEEAWHFLTGDLDNIHLLTEAIGYGFQRQGTDFLHPVVIVVVAADGKIVRYLYGTQFLPMDLTLALVEADEGRVGATIRRVVGFCFTYDPENRRYVFNLLRVTGTVVLASAGAFLGFLIFTGRKRKKS